MKCPKCNATEVSKNGHRKGRQCYKCFSLWSPISRSLPTLAIFQRYQATVPENVSLLSWDCEGLSESQTFTTRPSCTGFERQGCHYQMPQSPKKFLRLATSMNFKPMLPTNVTRCGFGLRSITFRQVSWLGQWVIAVSETFKPLWLIVKCFRCFFYVTDGWPVYRIFIQDGDHIVSKTYMTRVEGENTRLRHYLARLHRKTLCYSKPVEMLKCSLRLLLHYLKYWTVPLPV